MTLCVQRVSTTLPMEGSENSPFSPKKGLVGKSRDTMRNEYSNTMKTVAIFDLD